MVEQLSEEFKNEVKKQAREQAAKWTIAAASALVVFAATGWWFAAKPYIDDYIKRESGVGNVASVPASAIVAFDLPPSASCPPGWSKFKEATSRVIVGAGNSDEFYEEKYAFDDSGRRLSARAYRQHGGEEVVALTKSQMPRHNHGGRTSADRELRLIVNAHGGISAGVTGDARARERRLNVDATAQAVHAIAHDGGTAEGTQAHNNMPPYVALYYCKKDSG